MIALVTGFLAALRGSRNLMMALGILGAAIGYNAWKYHWINAGKQQQAAKQERVDNAVSTKVRNAGAKSRAPGSRGVLDPFTRDD